MNREQWSVWQYAMSWGFIGSCVTFNNPFELIRFRMQVMPVLYQQGYLLRLYKGCLDCARKVYKHEGFKAFFKGNLSNIIRLVPSETLVWQVKQRFHKNFHYRTQLTPTDHIKYNTIIGIASGLLVSFTLYPLQYVRQLILNRTDRQGRSIWHYVKKTVINQGFTGMYKGSMIFFLGSIIFRGTYFGIYDTLKVKTKDERCRWLFSFIATYISILISYPIDTVRRRFISSQGKYSNSRECFKDTWMKQGFKGLYSGWPMIAFQSVNAATVFFFYDRLITNYDEALD